MQTEQTPDDSSPDTLAQDTLNVMLTLGKLGEQIASDGPALQINSLFADLLERVARHFGMEEEMMEARAYVGRHWHVVVHRELLNEMRLALAQGIEAGTPVGRPILRRVRAVFSLDGEDDDVFRARAKLGMFREVLPAVHPADVAAALPEFDHQQRSEIFGSLRRDQASGALEEVPAEMQRELVAAMPIERVAELIDFMTPAQGASVLRNLTAAERWAIMQQLGPVRSRKIAALVEMRRKETLLHLATLRYLRAESLLACGQLIKDYPALAAQARVWRYIYVISGEGKLLGVADLRAVLLADPETTLASIMMTSIIRLHPDDPVEFAARQFEHYGFDALPVVADDDMLMGVLVARDVMTVGEW